MGRTISSFLLWEWRPFRKTLDKSDRKILDQMFSIVHLYNSAASYAAKPIRIQPIFIIFHHYKQLTRISEQVSNGGPT
jgi:hypothetical protein